MTNLSRIGGCYIVTHNAITYSFDNLMDALNYILALKGGAR